VRAAKQLLALTVAVAVSVFACGGQSSSAVDAGGGGDAQPAGDAGVGCDPYAFRSPSVELFVGPDGLESRLLNEINGATTSLDMMMYLLTLNEFVDAIVAAKNRGVGVRIMLDRNHPGNVDSRAALLNAGVDVHDSPSAFTHAHTKAMIIDGDRAIIMSSNLNYTSMAEERNYGVIDRDVDDIDDLQRVFDSDWNGGGSYPDLSCTRLIVSPVNSRQRILDHINRAETNLDLSVMYIAEDTTRNAIINRANAGISVRVLLADPAWMPDNATTATTLQNVGIPVKFAENISMHAKLVLADGVPLVGSENLSFTSYTENREVGAIVLNSAEQAKAQAQFEADWSAGVSP